MAQLAQACISSKGTDLYKAVDVCNTDKDVHSMLGKLMVPDGIFYSY